MRLRDIEGHWFAAETGEVLADCHHAAGTGGAGGPGAPRVDPHGAEECHDQGHHGDTQHVGSPSSASSCGAWRERRFTCFHNVPRIGHWAPSFRPSSPRTGSIPVHNVGDLLLKAPCRRSSLNHHVMQFTGPCEGWGVVVAHGEPAVIAETECIAIRLPAQCGSRWKCSLSNLVVIDPQRDVGGSFCAQAILDATVLRPGGSAASARTSRGVLSEFTRKAT